MTPDDFAAILAARTPGEWRHDTSPGTWNGGDIVIGDPPEGFVTTSGPDGDIPRVEDAAAIVAAVNLAPLLLDLWRAAAAWRERDYGYGKSNTQARDDLAAALAALEAAE